jgi:hypothetical protein
MSKFMINCEIPGVIQKDPHFVPVVKHARVVVSGGTRLRQDRHDDNDDDFDL